MTPKEKAIDLINTFTFADIYFVGGKETMLLNARNCSLLCANEAQKILKKPMFEYKESMIWKAEFEYWDKVKHELRLLHLTN